MDPQRKAILSLIVEIIGQDTLYAECGGDFDVVGCTADSCSHYHDCKRQLKLISQTQHLKAMIRVV